MAQLDFYALGYDLRSLFKFLYQETDVVVYEAYSESDSDLRQFASVAELETAFVFDQKRSFQIRLWSPSVTARPIIRRIELKLAGHSYRYCVEGVGLIQLFSRTPFDGVIYHTCYSHWNEAGARERSVLPADDCHWPALAKLSGRIQRRIRKLAVAKLCTRPILQQAFEAVQNGHGLSHAQFVHRADSIDIQKLSA